MIKTIKSFGYALAGITNTFRTELNFRIHIVMAFLAISLSFFLNISNLEWGTILLLISSILSAELINTAIERLTDEVSTTYNSQIKIVKDAMAGAVLVLAIFSVIIGSIIFIPKLITQCL